MAPGGTIVPRVPCARWFAGARSSLAVNDHGHPSHPGPGPSIAWAFYHHNRVRSRNSPLPERLKTSTGQKPQTDTTKFFALDFLHVSGLHDQKHPRQELVLRRGNPTKDVWKTRGFHFSGLWAREHSFCCRDAIHPALSGRIVSSSEKLTA